MAKIWEKTLIFLGLIEETEEEEVLEEAEFIKPQQGRKTPVLNLTAKKHAVNSQAVSSRVANSKNMRLFITKPQEYSDAQPIVEHIKNKKSVLVNLEDTDKNEARRIIDFISGATYAVDGNMQKVSQQIFVFTPAQVEVNADFRRELSERGMVMKLDE